MAMHMRHTVQSKSAYRALFLAIQADAKSYPGGIRAIAESIGINGNTLSNGLNPDSEAPPPSFPVILEIINVAQAKRSVFALAQLVGQVPMDFELEQRSPAEAVRLFLTLMHTVGDVLGKGSDAAKDGRFDPDERKMLEPMLLSLMKATGELLQAIRG